MANQGARKIDGAGALDADTQEDGEEFGIGEIGCTLRKKPFARSLILRPVLDRHR